MLVPGTATFRTLDRRLSLTFTKPIELASINGRNFTVWREFNPLSLPQQIGFRGNGFLEQPTSVGNTMTVRLNETLTRSFLPPLPTEVNYIQGNLPFLAGTDGTIVPSFSTPYTLI